MAIPFLVVTMGLLTDANGNTLAADVASKAAFNAMFSDSVILVMGSSAVGIAFSKCQYELRIASWLQKRCGQYPHLFLLAFMYLTAFLCCLVSNIAAPILLKSLLEPILRDLSRHSLYARTLLMALAFSANIGGLMTPIASPENLIVLGYVENISTKHSISWLTWMKVGLPFGIVSIFILWLYLTFVVLHGSQEKVVIPPILFEAHTMNKSDYIVLGLTITAVGLWCSLSYTRPIFGSMATIAIIPLIAFFATTILSKRDLSSFNWPLLLLIASGNVLGYAVESSRLLHLLSAPIIPYLAGDGVWTTVFTIVVSTALLAAIIPHTVAALILAPLIVSLGRAIHHTHSLVFAMIFQLNVTMVLPFSTFANSNSWVVCDDFDRPFLQSFEFIRHGTAVTVIMMALINTFGFALLRLAFGKQVVH